MQSSAEDDPFGLLITAVRIVEETRCQGVADPAMDHVHHPATIAPRP
jgi:hypothetical protein